MGRASTAQFLLKEWSVSNSSFDQILIKGLPLLNSSVQTKNSFRCRNLLFLSDGSDAITTRYFVFKR